MAGQKAVKRIPCRSKRSIVAENHLPWQSSEHSPPSCPWGNWTLVFWEQPCFSFAKEKSFARASASSTASFPDKLQILQDQLYFQVLVSSPNKANVFVKLLVWPQLIAWTRLLNNTKLIMLIPIIFLISWRVMTRWSHPSTVYRARKRTEATVQKIMQAQRKQKLWQTFFNWSNYKSQSTSKKNFESFQKHLTPMNFSFIKQRKIKMCFTRL